MALLDAVTAVALTGRGIIVATFDHGTGVPAREAVGLVARESAARGMPCVIGRTGRALRGEAEWRAARWAFLRDAAACEEAIIVTAHTQDDQVETVFIRALRDAGARGLAGLYARSDVLRPLLGVTRADVARYASDRGLVHIDDPSNLSRKYLRNRVRLDLLPAIARVRPEFAEEMLGIARRAAAWREELEAVVDALGIERLDPGTLRIATDTLAGYDAAELRVLWPAIAARVGITMDRRGTHRAAAFTTIAGAPAAERQRAGQLGPTGGVEVQANRGREGRVIQLAGGAEIARVRGGLILRRR